MRPAGARRGSRARDPSVKLESYRADAPFEVPADTLAEGTDSALSIPTVGDCA